MTRLSKVLCVGLFLFSLLWLAAQAESGADFDPAEISPELQDSLNGAKEPTLQEVLDGLGYNIDVVNDRLPTQIWVAITGQYSEVMLAELAEYSSRTASGWYAAGCPSDTHVVFRGANIPPDTAYFHITGCDSNGLFIAPSAEEEKCHYVYYTQKWLNPDHKDHAWVYWTKVRPNEFIVAWEDLFNLGDRDFQDLVLLYQLPNRPPILSVPKDTTYDLCYPQTICFKPITAYDEDYYDTVAISMILGAGTFEGDSCCFMPAQVDSTYEFTLVATDWLGATDTQTVTITVDINPPSELICPDDDSIHAGDTFVSTDFSVTDPDKASATVIFLDITPSATHDPTIVENHVEWATTCEENGAYVIRLVTTDLCGVKDTCEFTVIVYNQPPQFTCPEGGSVHAGDTFISTDFSVTCDDDDFGYNGNNGDSATVIFLNITPSATNDPTIVGSHVEWVTTCAEDGDYVIRLEATCYSHEDKNGDDDDTCVTKDTCEFTVNVYNRTPQLTCPDGGSVLGGDTLVSPDFSVTDPDGDSALVTFLDINPSAPNNPIIVENHVEWVTTGNDNGGYIIRLVATDPCGAEDTCEFTVNVNQQDFTISATPEDQYVIQGHLMRYLVKLTSLFGFDDPCTLFVSGLPNPPDSGVFDQSILTPTDSTGLNVYTTPATDTGSYTLTITAQAMSGGKATPLEHSIQVVLKVIESSDVGDGDDNPNSPKTFALFQNQPNPFNPETKISYYLPKTCEVKLTIYNILGQNIRTLFNGRQDAGMQTLFWDGRDNLGIQQSSGIYFYRLLADDFHQTKKMTLTR